jgi:hypothetical protein
MTEVREDETGLAFDICSCYVSFVDEHRPFIAI